ncbi:hypothetical protein DICPUDRAFT_31990 [Dictyostelium purpureum]|uniref:ABC transporter domain-containing protein n=1 Tax=Dictyostelium purpureum TaxID=5786 RepID=F0ZI61_DICPU|nr:uncharacterized protein DICPUDRAFT_31990 [Dictyostelium purpureum]EGC36350.1 hypothetical protein DICPUDRAFT_31990 [Dictyostelium purpureum]|eukprot:XP_003287104.1 hypothetical protein DICPUDRAFT_31990 [Dictyostelium purpureum]
MSYNHFSDDNDNTDHYSSRGTFGESVNREFLHLKLLLKKNLIVASRSLVSTAIEILSPIVFVLILLGISKINNNTNPTITYDQQLPICKPYSENRCFNLMFAPINSTATIEIMKILGETNNPAIPLYFYPNDTNVLPDLNKTIGLSSGIIGMESDDEIFEFTLSHPNITIGGVSFTSFPENFTVNGQVPNDSLITPNQNELSYNVIVNTTCPLLFASCPDYTIPINNAIQRAITIYYSRLKNNQNQAIKSNNTNNIFDYTSNNYPLYPVPETLAQQFGGLFYYCGSMITFIFLLYKVSFEKEHKLKVGMTMMGLSGPMYWVSWFINCLIIDLLITLITLAIGAASQINFFLGTNFFVLFFTFYLFTISMSAVGFFLLTFIQSTKTAIGIGMGIFIVGSIFQLIFSSMGSFIFQLIYETDNSPALAARIILFVLPMFHFTKILTDIGNITKNYPSSHFTWSELNTNLNSQYLGTVIPTTGQSLGYLMVLLVAYIILAWYFEHVIPGNDGTSQPPYFFLLPSYWGFTLKKVKHIPIPHFEDEDVRQATEKAHDPNNPAPVIIRGLSKTYTKPLRPKKTVHAVKFLSLSIEQGSILCLLGSNGAGKTTTISMLTGLTEPSSGDALIYGNSVVSNINAVRKITSVVPQHDILWNELSAKEHLELFAELKGIPKHQRENSIRAALDQVKLTKVADNRISTYSGGMKRRLSVAIACIGDPKILFCDEPTTGMDPASRRHIWNLLKNIKKDKVIILTSHFMDECEILGDRVVIMSNGYMACNGNSLQLKAKFGEGYSVNLVAKSQESVPFLVDFVLKSIPNSKFLRQSALLLNFGFPLETDSNIVYNFFGQLEKMVQDENNKVLRDWEISHSNLNDVFLKVAHLSKQKNQ